MRKDAAENYKAIVEVASELIVREGADVSLRAIAKEAGVGVATATRHFPERNDLYRAVLDHTLEQLRVVVEEHVRRFPEAPDEVWRSAVNSIVDIHFPAVGQEIIPKLAPQLKPKEIIRNEETLLGVYRPLVQQAKEHQLCPENMKLIDFHYAIVALSRPLPEPAESLLTEQRTWLIDLFLEGLQVRAQAGKAGGTDLAASTDNGQ